jgi:hypothetical protein
VRGEVVDSLWQSLVEGTPPDLDDLIEAIGDLNDRATVDHVSTLLNDVDPKEP